ncbi:Type-2 histone deacetylase 2 [Auxenochlorella protothecoides]|uniref:Type-2 histone deacetylase 2 n=1 Tax=Auxenochlorella protothecoides TaxID=3075 RepID=A0A087SJB7_AUXPR|nr:Type-2 histone deacetylase 2 [Auxenochlorella protothecoides]KFM25821.1 Type-2 histone deacetylase 2 [Auxenochlorella protothecoides]
MAVCMGSHPSYERFALAASSLLLDAGAVPFERDDWGRTALHWAAFLGLTDVAQLLLLRGQQWAEREAAQDSDAPAIPPLQEFQARCGCDKAGNTALHLAARHRREGVLHLFLRADPPLRVRNRAGQLAAHAAALGGCQACLTLVLAPPECWQHHTAPWPRARASPEPPPENVGRLTALTHPTLGALRGAEAGPVLWDEAGKRVALGDLLRVHDWSYVRGIQRACEDLPDPGVVGGPTEGRGVARVALLDFDVHHGNGTEACVVRAAPSLQRVPFSTPYSEGTFPVYKPWLDADDKDNIFFASVQGFGPKAEGMNAYVYPGSGATGDNRIADDAARSAAGIAEDPDAEFLPTGEDSVGAAPPSAPRVIDVGIGGPGTKVALWRRSWRDKIIPALVNFRPDFIFISAGFDAHRKDEINFRYIGVTERDFEWLTDQLVQVANLCCHGRIVSVLEGGYRIQGGKVSAFSRSVAAHVRALADDHRMEWDPKAAEVGRAGGGVEMG